MKILNILLLLSVSLSLKAKTFENDYLQMLIPDSWTCNVQQNSWICHEPTSKEKIEAIYILNAKRPGPDDNFKSFHNVLGTAKTIRDASGSQVSSKVLSKKEVFINDHTWVYAFHKNSEIYGYNTQYVTTLDKGLSVLVSLSCTEETYSDYKDIFMKSIMSLKVKQPKPLTLDQRNDIKKINPYLSPEYVVGNLEPKKPFVDFKNPKFLALIMGVLALGLVAFAFKK